MIFNLRFRWLITLVTLCFGALLHAQPNYSVAEKLQGYKINGDTTIFIFDETIYNVQPKRVLLEGEMRGWNHDMDDSAWRLKQDPSDPNLWLLRLLNPEFAKTAPQTQFKFRIDEGEWMSAPNDAPNEKNGNLVFAYDVTPTKVRAELVSTHHVRVIISGDNVEISLKPNGYRLTRAGGIDIPISTVLRISPKEIHIYPSGPLDLRRVHFVETLYLKKKTVASFNGYFRHLYSDKELGANYDHEKNQTVFRVFSPRAAQIRLYLYDTPNSEALQTIEMTKDEQGVWEAIVAGNQEGRYYDFTVHGPNDPGNYFYEQHPVHVSDPYARVNVEAYGRSRVWPRVESPTPLRHGIPKMENLIAYEVHVQDFTNALEGLHENKKGTFAGMIETGLRNARGEKIGFDHLVELGINAVHLMPVQEFLHYPDDEWQQAFLHDPYMIERGINEYNYQWGYRISHFFALENEYRIKGTEHGAQNEQFRDLVEAFHEKDIAVILDFVFNHTAENMDDRDMVFNFKAFDAQYYYRTDEHLRLIGAFGNETKSEDRLMVQRWIIDQCKFFVEEYGIDGFRIDLAGLTDKQTLIALRRALGPEIILYGEPWIDSSDPSFQENSDWDWYKEDAPITYFDDDFRNAIHGPPSNPKQKETDRGYAGGNGNRENAMKAISAGFPTEHTPLSGINYLDIHDDWAMADRFATEDWDGRKGVDEGPFKIAAAMLFTSLGPIVLHGGTELMRSKASAPLEEVIKHTRSGPIYLHGKHDTYNLAKANLFEWSNKGKSCGDDGDAIKCNYDNMFHYWKGLIALRLSEHGKVCRIAEKPPAGYVKWFESENKMLLGYMIAEKLLVLVNTGTDDAIFSEVQLPPDSKWKLAADDQKVDYAKGISGKPDSELQALTQLDLQVPKQSVKIWIRE